MVNETRLLILILILQVCCTFPSQAQAPSMVGRWEIEIAFTNGKNRSLRLDAEGAGRGSLMLVDSRSNLAEPATPSEANWGQGDKNSVRFSGGVVFPIGNVGRAPWTLVFKGKFDKANSITGEVAFLALDQAPNASNAKPVKTGTFKAIRAASK